MLLEEGKLAPRGSEEKPPKMTGATLTKIQPSSSKKSIVPFETTWTHHIIITKNTICWKEYNNNGIVNNIMRHIASVSTPDSKYIAAGGF